MGRKVLLMTTVRWTSTARYAGGFAAASWSVDALAPPGAPVTLSRYVDHHHVYRPLAAIASLRKAVLASRADLVVPCDDRAVGLLLRLYGKELAAKRTTSAVASLIRRSLGATENYAAMMSRSASMAIAREIGIRTPATVSVASETELDACLDTIGLPAVVKVDGSWGGDGVVVARSRAEAVDAYRRLVRPASRLRNVARALRRRDAHYLLAALSPPRARVSVQQFVPGRSSASAFACWQGGIVAELCYDVLVADGTIGPPNVIRRVDCPQMREASLLVAKRFGLSGIFGLDFIRDEAGDAHLIEINPRTTQGGTLAFGPGRDLPSALAACVTQCETSSRPAVTSDVVAFFPREWQRDPQSPYLTSGHHDVPWDDAAVLKHCLESLPEARDPARMAALELLKLSAPARRDDAELSWRRGLRNALARS